MGTLRIAVDDRVYHRRLEALGAALHFVIDLLTVSKLFEARDGDHGIVRVHIVAGWRSQESEAKIGIKPAYFPRSMFGYFHSTRMTARGLAASFAIVTGLCVTPQSSTQICASVKPSKAALNDARTLSASRRLAVL